MSEDSDQELLSIKRGRLQQLERQAALYGIDTRPHISLEIEDLRKEIEQLEQKHKATRQRQLPTRSSGIEISAPPLQRGILRNRTLIFVALGSVLTVSVVALYILLNARGFTPPSSVSQSPSIVPPPQPTKIPSPVTVSGPVQETSIAESVTSVQASAEPTPHCVSQPGAPVWQSTDVITPDNGSQLQELARITHRGNITRAVALSPDGRLLGIPSDDRVYLYDTKTRGMMCNKQAADAGHEVTSVTFAPDVASGEDILAFGWKGRGKKDPQVWLWNVTNGTLSSLFPHESAVWSIAFSPDRMILATGTNSGTLRLWRVQDGKEAPISVGQTAIHSIAFSPDGMMLASGSGDGTVTLWEVDDEKLTLKWKENYTGPKGVDVAVLSVAFAPDGMTLASGSQDRTIKLWDVAGGMLSRPLGEEDHTKSVLSIAFGNEGKVLAAASGDGTVWLWDVVNKRKIDQLEGHTARVISVVFTPDGKALVSASGDGTVLLWGIK